MTLKKYIINIFLLGGILAIGCAPKKKQLGSIQHHAIFHLKNGTFATQSDDGYIFYYYLSSADGTRTYYTSATNSLPQGGTWVSAGKTPNEVEEEINQEQPIDEQVNETVESVESQDATESSDGNSDASSDAGISDGGGSDGGGGDGGGGGD